jgi:hypothetical protein
MGGNLKLLHVRNRVGDLLAVAKPAAGQLVREATWSGDR